MGWLPGSRKDGLLSRDDYLAKLADEISLLHGERLNIRSNWSTIASLAGTLLPQLPGIGFFSNRKRRLAYLHLERKLEVMVIQEKITREVKGHILLLMEFSSRRSGRRRMHGSWSVGGSLTERLF